MKHTSLLKRVSSGWLATAIVATVLVAGCGGGNSRGGIDSGAIENVPDSVGESVVAMVNYLATLFTQTSETTEPLGVNSLTLAADDTAEPSPTP